MEDNPLFPFPFILPFPLKLIPFPTSKQSLNVKRKKKKAPKGCAILRESSSQEDLGKIKKEISNFISIQLHTTHSIANLCKLSLSLCSLTKHPSDWSKETVLNTECTQN